MTRKITDDEKALWKQATRDVKNAAAQIDDFVVPGIKIKVTENIRVHKPQVKTPPHKTSLVMRMIEKDNLKKLATGKTKIDARLDLHGMWLNEAHRSVVNFILNARDHGKRRLLIITGKGGVDGGGRIRSELPMWLGDPQIAGLISAFNQSSPRHGGAGAFYIVLRKSRL